MQVPTWAGALTNPRGIRFTEMTGHGAPVRLVQCATCRAVHSCPTVINLFRMRARKLTNIKTDL